MPPRLTPGPLESELPLPNACAAPSAVPPAAPSYPCLAVPPPLQRLDRVAARHPRLALPAYTQLIQQARSAGALELALDGLYAQFYLAERMGAALEQQSALSAGLEEAAQAHLTLQAARLHEALGRVAYQRGEYFEASEQWSRTLDLANLAGDLPAGVAARIGLGQIHYALGAWDKGRRFHRDAAEMLGRIDHSYLAAKLALNMGVGHFENAQLTEAEQQFRHGLAQALRGPHADFIGEAHWQLARTALSLHQPEQAASECQQALGWARRLGHRWLEGMACQTWTDIAIARGDPTEAIRSCREALSLAQQIHARAGESQAHAQLARLLQQQGDTASALQHLWQHQSLRDEIERLSLPERLLRLAHYDLSRKPPEEMLLELSNRHWRIESEADVVFAAREMREAAQQIMQLDAVHFWWASESAGVLRLHDQPRGDAASTAAPPLSPPLLLRAPAQAQYLQLLNERKEALAVHDLRLHPCGQELALLNRQAQAQTQGAGSSSLGSARSRIEIPLFVQNRLVALLWLEQHEQPRSWSRQDLLQASHLGRLFERLLVGHDLACAQHAQWLMEQEKADALGRLVAGVAHEVNTPIGVAVTAASSVSENALKLAAVLRGEKVSRAELTELSARLISGSDLVERNLQRAAALIGNFKKVTVDQASEAVSDFVLLDYLRSVISVLGPALRKAAVSVSLDVDAAIELHLAAGLLTQVVSNLVMNSINHAFPEGRGGQIRISARLEGRHVLIDVADDGCGASADVRARMFEPFFTTKRGKGGSGLGLYIVASLMERLEGEVELPPVERGLCVRLRLPRGRPGG